jgi:cyclopropane fatty-acyl-phospholipid synthase-like methyltransferase
MANRDESDTRMKWEKWNASGGPRYPHEKIVQFTFRSFPVRERVRTPALDLGCGSGVHTVFLAQEGFDVFGVDISPLGIENARQWLTQRGLSAHLAVQDLAALDLPEERFRLVVCAGVLDSAGHAATRQAIPRVRRAMARGGRGIFVFASDRDFRVTGDNEYQLHGFRREEVEDAFQAKAGEAFSELFIDRYITTYRGGTVEQNDWLVSVVK